MKKGLEKPYVMPIRYRNSLIYTQRFINTKLRKFRHFYRAYINNIVIFNRTKEEHLRYINIVLKKFAKTQITLSPEKFLIRFCKIRLLRFLINKRGVRTTKKQINALKIIKIPTTLTNIEAYINLVTYLLKYIL